MRFALLVCLGLAGCATLSESPIPKQPTAPIGDNLSKVGSEIDKSDNRVGSAIAVAAENADKPAVVKAELSVASAYLPPPPPNDLAFARQRAARQDAAEYGAAVAYGKKMLSRIDSSWAAMQADQVEAARVSGIKDRRIADLQKEIERVQKDASRNIFNLTGAFLIVAGGLACAFASIRVGIPLLICGAFAGAVPYILGSIWFPWFAGTTMVILAGIGIFLVWERYIKPPAAVITDSEPDGPPNP